MRRSSEAVGELDEESKRMELEFNGEMAREAARESKDSW